MIDLTSMTKVTDGNTAPFPTPIGCLPPEGGIPWPEENYILPKYHPVETLPEGEYFFSMFESDLLPSPQPEQTTLCAVDAIGEWIHILLGEDCIPPEPYLPLTGEPVEWEIVPLSRPKNSIADIKPPFIFDDPERNKDKRNLVELQAFATEQLLLMVYQGQLYEFTPPCWMLLDRRSCVIRLRECWEVFGFTKALTSHDYNEVYQLLLADPHIQKGAAFESPLHCLNLRDGTLDIATMQFYPHDPNDGFFHYLDMNYHQLVSPDGGHVFEPFVAQMSNGDSCVRQQLLELVALAITGYEAKSFYVLLGPSNTGKTQFGRFLGELVGRDHVANVAGVHDFGNRFTTSALVGKRLALCLDLPDAPLSSTAVGIIKQIVGDDSIKVEAKYKDSQTIYEKPLLVFAGNHPIRIPNIVQETALLNRMITIPFSNPVAEEDMQQQLYKALLAEAPYIVSCAIEAYRDLMQRNFVLTRSVLPEIYSPQDSREGVQALEAFLRTRCAYDEESETSTDCLYQAYDLFAMEHGFSALPKVDFGRLLSAALKQGIAKTMPLKRCNGKDARGYRGIRLRTEEPSLETQ